MKNGNFWGTDRVLFRAAGPHLTRLLSQAAAQGIRLRRVRRDKAGLTAQAFGREYTALQALARREGWQLTLLRRQGPGRFLERLARRPGIPVGALLFLGLLHGLSRFVWSIDFGGLSPELQNRMRQLLTDCGVTEGVLLDTDTLQRAQTAALEQSDLFGWISLNFTGGCLQLESTPAQYQTLQPEAPLQPLYAKESGEILAVETQSGYTMVKVGQQVEKGQLLVDVIRLDRSGRQIPQGASGTILARIEKSYTASQPLEEVRTFLSGQRAEGETFTLLGYTWHRGEATADAPDGLLQVEWEPLQLGRVSLPGSLCRRTVWFEQEQRLVYSAEQAQALARRACRAQLLAEFPDAEIESEQRTVEGSETEQSCTITYLFRANLATS